MALMVSLWDVPDDPTLTPEERFELFHAKNPQVYEALKDLASEQVEIGHEKIAIDMLYNVLRWQRSLQTVDDPFRLNNNFRSRYARLLMKNEPRLAGKFETRTLHAK